MQIIPIKTALFREGEALVPFLRKHLPKLREKSVVIITSKIVALAEGRVRESKSEKTREKIIKEESEWAMRTKYTWLTIREGVVMLSAGVDESNANGKIILLPKDSYKTAQEVRKKLRKLYKVKNLGVIITDSRLLPLRSGIVGIALGYAGFKGINDYRGTKDIFGRKLHLSKADAADSLATAAVLTMGEGAEQRPLAVITGAPVTFQEKTNRRELYMDFREDVYQPLFEKAKSIKLKKRKSRS